MWRFTSPSNDFSNSEKRHILSKYQIDGSVVFDSQAMTLSRGDIVTTLTANETELLCILMQGTASKQAVIEQIWESKGLFVTEGSYHQLVRALRVKLDEQGIPPTQVKTLPRLGLRFLGFAEPLDEAPPSPDAHAASASSASSASPIASEPAPTAAPADMQAPPAASSAPDASPAPIASASPPPSGPPSGEAGAARPVTRTAHARSPRRRVAHLAIYVTLAAWASVLTWQTFRHRDNTFRFRFTRTIDGIHYFSDGRMNQPDLLKAIDVKPLKGSFVYEIELGSNDWLAVCPESIYETPELCQAYFIEKSN
ncbi:winged helix-turn-helix domain-containing protein [Burkholderia thailandensis]|uniref:winged helix-turn-helix domain-containing protein n=1 Tax=Burkholderia thailandensis TaxID=57975 RepID=UPI0005F26F7F|nr:transcriptional regulator [Burkholderia thailandensis]AOJ59398.1 transcriptional regulator [Burkholderia thailandensis]KXF58520.1 transcriptional regulator [Burkholderia thailandensis]PNE78896.1 transcriptional regulator [Burkholderia thailandensis]